jgi:hypothetical protein
LGTTLADIGFDHFLVRIKRGLLLEANHHQTLNEVINIGPILGMSQSRKASDLKDVSFLDRVFAFKQEMTRES